MKLVAIKVLDKLVKTAHSNSYLLITSSKLYKTTNSVALEGVFASKVANICVHEPVFNYSFSRKVFANNVNVLLKSFPELSS